jgi:hypothetical protein
MKFKAIQYVKLKNHNNTYRDFLLQKFEVENLFLFEKKSNTLFIDWRGTNLGSWYKFVNPQCGVMLEFFSDEYKLHMPKKVFVFHFPTTVNEFISDCDRVGLDLYWDETKMDKSFEFKSHYVNEEESNLYYKELLTKIEKENVF